MGGGEDGRKKGRRQESKAREGKECGEVDRGVEGRIGE